MSMTVAEADAQLTAPGQMFETDVVDIRGVATRSGKTARPPWPTSWP